MHVNDVTLGKSKNFMCKLYYSYIMKICDLYTYKKCSYARDFTGVKYIIIKKKIFFHYKNNFDILLNLNLVIYFIAHFLNRDIFRGMGVERKSSPGHD